MAEELALGIGMEFSKRVGEKLADEMFKLVEKSSYGKISLIFFLVVDFIEPLRLDEWGSLFRRVLADSGFRREGNEYLVENILRIKDVATDYFYLPSEDYETDEEDTLEEFDDGVLYVKRMKIYATPETLSFSSKSVSKLTDIAEAFIRYLNYKNTFFGIRIIFEDVTKAVKFKEKVQNRLNELGIKCVLYHSENKVDVIVVSLSKVIEAFRVIEDELFAHILAKLKKMIGL